MKESRLVTDNDMMPQGFGCVDCNYQFEVGDEMVSVLIGMVEDIPMTETKCPKCAEGADE